MFLSLWLCGWAAGELCALFALSQGAAALISGDPVTADGDRLALAPSLGAGLFLLVWLAFWTLGGVVAIHDLFRNVLAEDVLEIRGDRLEVLRRSGPFRSRRAFARAVMHRVGLSRPGALMLWTRDGSVELSSVGTARERQEAASRLREALGLPERHEAEVLPILPDAWQEIVTAEGARAIVPSPRRRRIQAFLAAVCATLVLALAVAIDAPGHSDAPIAALVVLAVAGLFAYAALWLARGRMEWVLGPARLRRQRRLGRDLALCFEAERLEVVESRDSDGDARFELRADGRDASGRARRETIDVALLDPTRPRELCAWLARATGLPWRDRCGDADREGDLAGLLERLEAGGPLARGIAGWLRGLRGGGRAR